MSWVANFAAAPDARSPRNISIDGGAASVSFSSDFFGSVNVRITELPCCRAARSVTGLGNTGRGGVGTPGAPHATMHTQAANAKKKTKQREGAETARMPGNIGQRM